MKTHYSPSTSSIFVFPASMFYMYVHNLIGKNQFNIAIKIIKTLVLQLKLSILLYISNGIFWIQSLLFQPLSLPSLNFPGHHGCLYSVATSLLLTYFGLVMVSGWLNSVCVMCIKRKKLVNSPSWTSFWFPLSSINIVLFQY